MKNAITSLATAPAGTSTKGIGQDGDRTHGDEMKIADGQTRPRQRHSGADGFRPAVKCMASMPKTMLAIIDAVTSAGIPLDHAGGAKAGHAGIVHGADSEADQSAAGLGIVLAR